MAAILDFKMADSADQYFMTSIELSVPDNINRFSHQNQSSMTCNSCAID